MNSKNLEIFLSEFNVGDKIKRPEWSDGSYVQIMKMNSGINPYAFMAWDDYNHSTVDLLKTDEWILVEPAYKDEGISKATIIYIAVGLIILLQAASLIIYRKMVYKEWKEKVEKTSEIYSKGLFDGQVMVLNNEFVTDSIKQAIHEKD